MNRKIAIGIAGLVTATVIGTAYAQQGGNPAIKARQSIMQLYAFNLGALGAMAKGEAAYNADAATSAANNLVTLTQLDQSAMWPAGSDNAADTSARALPALWQNFPDVMTKGAALSDAYSTATTGRVIKANIGRQETEGCSTVAVLRPNGLKQNANSRINVRLSFS